SSGPFSYLSVVIVKRLDGYRMASRGETRGTMTSGGPTLKASVGGIMARLHRRPFDPTENGTGSYEPCPVSWVFAYALLTYMVMEHLRVPDLTNYYSNLQLCRKCTSMQEMHLGRKRKNTDGKYDRGKLPLADGQSVGVNGIVIDAHAGRDKHGHLLVKVQWDCQRSCRDCHGKPQLIRADNLAER